MELAVYVPTRGRTSLTSITLEELGKFAPDQPTFVVCPSNEVAHYQRKGHKVIECMAEGIGPTRQWIMQHGPQLTGARGVVMLDDDIYFSKRVHPDAAVPLERVTDLKPLFQWISDQLDNGYAHGGISARQGNNHIPRPWVDCIRVNNAHFFDALMFNREDIQFDALPLMEDFFVTLSLLLRGYPNRVAYHYCWSQRGSGTKGGCSLYRTAALQAEAAEKLHSIFPDYVKVVEKTAASGGSVFAGVARKDVNIQWLKAWADGQHRVNPYLASGEYTPATPDLARR